MHLKLSRHGQNNYLPGIHYRKIMNIYKRYGGEDYDWEPVSQGSRPVQCAMLAMDEMGDQD